MSVSNDINFQLQQDLHRFTRKKVMLAPSRFEADSMEMFNLWKVNFKACLRGDATPSPQLEFMFPDIVHYIHSTRKRYLFFKIDTLQTETLISGTASGRKFFMRLQQGVPAIVRMSSFRAVITELVFAVDLFILAFTAIYPTYLRTLQRPHRMHA